MSITQSDSNKASLVSAVEKIRVLPRYLNSRPIKRSFYGTSPVCQLAIQELFDICKH